MTGGFLRSFVSVAFLTLSMALVANGVRAEGAKKPAGDERSVGKDSGNSPQSPKAVQPSAPVESGAAKIGKSSGSTPPQSRLVEEKFKDWVLQCVVGSSATPPCQIMYRLTSPNQKQVALVLSVARFPKGKISLQMALPLGFSISQGVDLAFGKKYSTVARVSRCTVQGCLVEGEAPTKMIAAMLHETNGVVSVHNMEGRQIELPISLSGFSAAFEALKGKG